MKTKKKWNRIIAILLAVVMILGTGGIASYAEDLQVAGSDAEVIAQQDEDNAVTEPLVQESEPQTDLSAASVAEDIDTSVIGGVEQDNFSSTDLEDTKNKQVPMSVFSEEEQSSTNERSKVIAKAPNVVGDDTLNVTINLYDYDDNNIIDIPSNISDDNIFLIVWVGDHSDISEEDSDVPWAIVDVNNIKGNTGSYSIAIDKFNTQSSYADNNLVSAQQEINLPETIDFTAFVSIP